MTESDTEVAIGVSVEVELLEEPVQLIALPGKGGSWQFREESVEVMGPLFCNRLFKRLARAVFVLDVTRAELVEGEPIEQVILEALLTLLKVPADLGDDE